MMSRKRALSEDSSNSDDDDDYKRPKHLRTLSPSNGVEGNSGTMSSSGDDEVNANKSPSDDQDDQDDLYSKQAQKMMKLMGYQKNMGLGKKLDGLIDPIMASDQKGRRGLGLKLDGLDKAAVNWDPNIEVITVKEPVEWLENDSLDLQEIGRDLLDSWIVVDNRKLTIDDETHFCDGDVLREVLQSKSIFDNLGANDMRQARTKSNPFETIHRVIFQNRAAVKMANIDSMCDFMFTNPVDENGGPLVRDNDLLYFADVCAGPGGFTEYVLWRKNWEAKGFGFTLKKENDFKLDEFYAASPDTFDPFYGVKEDGNVFDQKNIESFTNYVLKQTGTGVHFMMADGGFSVEGQENIQEILSKQLYLCQCIVALSIVRERGHFVCKLFDVFTPFTVGLIYLMYKCFQKITICKPNTSRPANSERYLVCKWKKSDTDTIQRHLFDINCAMWEPPNKNVDTLELVPLSVLQNDEKFYNYIVESNNLIGRNQIIGLLKIAAFCKDPTLVETRQSDLKKNCLKLWDLPDAMRKAPVKKTNDQLCTDLLKDWAPQRVFLSAEEVCLEKKKDLNVHFGDTYDWYFMPLDTLENSGKNLRAFFMSRGRRDVLYFNTFKLSWYPVHTISGITLEMSPNTLIYGEIVKELIGEGKSQIISYSLHIIDGLQLGGVDIRNFPLKRRNEMCQKFAKALNKPRKIIANSINQEMSTSIRCKQLFRFRDMEQFFQRLNVYKLKDGKKRLGYNIRNLNDDDQLFFVPHGLLFLKETKQHLMKAYSKSNQKFYYFDRIVKHAFYPETIKNPELIYSSMKSTFVCRKLWKWEMEPQVMEDRINPNPEGDLLYRTDFNEFILEKNND